MRKIPPGTGDAPAGHPASDDDARRAGLCATCRHARRVPSSRNQIYFLCEHARDDPAYPKYPATPVRLCRAYTRAGQDPDRS